MHLDLFVPEGPRLEVHERLHEHRGDVEPNVRVVLVLAVHALHGRGERRIELRLIAHVERRRICALLGLLRVALTEGVDHVPLEVAVRRALGVDEALGRLARVVP